MEILKIKNSSGEWQDIPALVAATAIRALSTRRGGNRK